MAHITENASRAGELIQRRRALRREFWRVHSPHELHWYFTKCTEMDLHWITPDAIMDTIMNKSSISPTEWPADYFAQQSSDASSNFIKELLARIRAVTLNSHIKKHK